MYDGTCDETVAHSKLAPSDGSVSCCYGHLKDAWDGYHEFLLSLIRASAPKRILEVGGGANPALSLTKLCPLGVSEYAVLDISERELARTPSGYRKICADVCADSLPVRAGYDLIISRMLAEHVRYPRRFHRNVFDLLAAGGRAFHFFPTLLCPVFLANALIPERIGFRLLRLFTPETVRDPREKFPAYYRWTYGPVEFQIRRFEQMGYEVEMYKGFFGHGYYDRIPAVRDIHRGLTSLLLRHPVPLLTSSAYLVLRRPMEALTDE